MRFFHWTLVSLFIACWLSAENGWMQWHYYFGYGVIALLVIRLVWGFVGPKEARFSTFITSPKRAFLYLRNIRKKHANTDTQTHSPAGGYSVIAMLLLLSGQTASGLFAVETDGFDGGPFSELIDYDLSLEISELHQLNFDILIWFIGLHVLAVVFYQRVLKQKLLQKML